MSDRNRTLGLLRGDIRRLPYHGETYPLLISHEIQSWSSIMSPG